MNSLDASLFSLSSSLVLVFSASSSLLSESSSDKATPVTVERKDISMPTAEGIRAASVGS